MLSQQNISVKRLWMWVGGFIGLSIGAYFGMQTGIVDGMDIGIAEGRELGGIEMQIHQIKRDRIADIAGQNQ